MWLIQNRETKEYIRRNGKPPHKVYRDGWNTFANAKQHVAVKINLNNFDWYLDADFIEVLDDGEEIRVIPVTRYLQEYFDRISAHNEKIYSQLTKEQKARLWYDAF